MTKKPTQKAVKTTKNANNRAKMRQKTVKKPPTATKNKQTTLKTKQNVAKKRIKTTKKPLKTGSIWWRAIKFIIYWLSFLGAIAAIIGLAIFLYYSLDLPNPDKLKVPKTVPTVSITTSDGEVLTHRAAQQSGHIAIKLLPKHAIQALVSIEDRGFYSHNGVDVFGIMRAAIANIINGNRAQGGSTLTQQLAKMLYLKPEKKLKRKVQEAMLAVWLESKYEKDELLNLYFNRAYFGAGANGIEAASQKYFDKSARYLQLHESALLAGLMKAPSAYNPIRHPERAKKRQKLVLNAMLDEGYISKQQHQTALTAPLGIKRTNVASQAQYAADWIMRDMRGLAGDLNTDITVEATIDPYLQQMAENALNGVMDAFSTPYKAGQAALILMDQHGAVRALVGGRNYGKSSFNRVINAKRQPGSVFKPFVYLAALEAGYKPTSKVKDAPIRFKNWRPKNYNGKYYGNVTLTNSLAKSMNSVSLRLAKKLGSKKIIATARRLGIASDLRQDLSIALGTSEVSLQELTNGYLPFMNGGFDADAHIIAKITGQNNRNIYSHFNDGSERIVAKQHVLQMRDMLFAVTDWGTGKKAQIPNFQAFGKTGTTQNYKDGWFIGFTSEYIAGVWVGNDDGKPTNKVTGGNLPAQIWHDLMAKIHDGLDAEASDSITDLLNSQ